ACRSSSTAARSTRWRATSTSAARSARIPRIWAPAQRLPPNRNRSRQGTRREELVAATRQTGTAIRNRAMRRAIRNPLRDARALSARALREDPQCALARGHASAPIRKESAIRRPGDQRPPNPQQIRNPQSEIRNRTGFCYDRPSMRSDNRTPATLRPFTITPNINMHAEGSVLVEAGRTRVICTASVEDRVPQFLRGTGKGWVTAEYGMLPRATTTRTSREASTGKVGGRTQEIQRLIGRSLRSVVRLEELGER